MTLTFFMHFAGPFPGVYFSGQPGAHNPWQPPVPHNMQKNLSEAIHSFNNAPSSSFGQSTSQGTSPQPQSQGLQFGAFGAPNFPQFGQLTSDFGQSPFIRTGDSPIILRQLYHTCLVPSPMGGHLRNKRRHCLFVKVVLLLPYHSCLVYLYLYAYVALDSI